MKYHLEILKLHGRTRWGGYPNKSGIFPGEKGSIKDSWTTTYLPKLKQAEKEFKQKIEMPRK